MNDEKEIKERSLALNDRMLDIMMRVESDLGKLITATGALEKTTDKFEVRLLNLEQSNRLLDTTIQQEQKENKDFRAEIRADMVSEQETNEDFRATWDKRWAGNGDPGVKEVIDHHKTRKNFISKIKDSTGKAVTAAVLAVLVGGGGSFVGLRWFIGFVQQPAKLTEENKKQSEQIDALIQGQTNQQKQIDEILRIERKRAEDEERERQRMRNAKRRKPIAMNEPMLATRRDHLANRSVSYFTFSDGKVTESRPLARP